MMRILYVLPSLLTGGAEAVVCHWAGYLHRAGHQVEVCTLYTGGPFTQRLSAQGIPIHNLNHDAGIERYQLRRKYDPRLVLSLAGVIRQGDYQIVHGHLFPALLHLALASVIVSHPAYLYSEHSIQNRRRRYASMKVLDRFLYSRYRKIIPVSEAVQAALCRWLPELSTRVQVIPNTVDKFEVQVSPGAASALRKELGISAEERIILFAGRLVTDKGPDLLLEAADQLARRSPAMRIRVIIAGDGPFRADLEALARSLPAPAQATLLGVRDDIPRLLELADLVVLPSRWEGLPVFLLEAMTAGKAILAAQVGGIPEAIQHDVSGWLVPSGDPAALADALAVLLPHEGLRARLGECARKAFEERYSPQSAVEKLLQLYRSFALQTGYSRSRS